MPLSVQELGCSRVDGAGPKALLKSFPAELISPSRLENSVTVCKSCGGMCTFREVSHWICNVNRGNECRCRVRGSPLVHDHRCNGSSKGKTGRLRADNRHANGNWGVNKIFPDETDRCLGSTPWRRRQTAKDVVGHGVDDSNGPRNRSWQK